MSTEFIWSDGIEHALHHIHKNSLAICEYHSRNYSRIKGYQKYFRVPIIILSGLNSVFSVGLQPFVAQEIISVLCCSISLICGIISSLELFVGVQTKMEKELLSSKEFYILSCDIFKVLSIERNHRTVDGNIYLDTIHNKYCSLIEQSDLVDKKNKKYRLHITPIDFHCKNVPPITYLLENEKHHRPKDHPSNISVCKNKDQEAESDSGVEAEVDDDDEADDEAEDDVEDAEDDDDEDDHERDKMKINIKNKTKSKYNNRRDGFTPLEIV